MRIKNLSQMKKWAKIGGNVIVLENAIKTYHENSPRKIKVIQTNGWQTEKVNGERFWIYFQRAKNMRFNDDNTVDFILGEQVNDDWVIKQQREQGKDYWLKLKLVD